MKKKFLTKILSIALVCVMMIMCMGAYDGEVNASSNKLFLIKNGDGTYSISAMTRKIEMKKHF